MTTIAGRTALITGGAQGIGLELARSLARAGARIALTDLDAERLDTARRELSATADVRTWVLDVCDRERFAEVAVEAEHALGPVSILCNNAGVLDSVSPSRMNYEQWDWNLGVNLGGVYNGIQTILPGMIARREGGHIVNTASEAGVAAGWSGFMYHASKYAVVGLSESLRSEIARHDIGVTVLCPGYVRTRIIDNSQSMRPEAAPQNSPGVVAALEAGREELRAGCAPAELAELAADAIRHNHGIVFTRASIGGLIRERADAMIDRVPVPVASQAAG